MSATFLAADGVVLSSGWVLGALGGAGAAITLLFKLLMASKDRELSRLQEDFRLYKEQVAKDDLRRDKEDARVRLLVEEAIRKAKKR